MGYQTKVRDQHLCTWLQHSIGELLDVSPAAIDIDARFRDLGLDSMNVSELVTRLGDHLGIVMTMPTTLAWEHATPAGLAHHAAHVATGCRPAVEPVAAGTDSSSSPASEPIAVIGLSCRLPGGAASPGALWAHLCERGHGADPIGARRRGIDGGDGFDAAFFGVSARQAEQMDPHQRLALELAWEVLEDAGVAPLLLRECAVGVFMGSTWGFFPGLLGMNPTVSTACPSSAMAVHLACQSLRNRETTIALAGGVQVKAAGNGHAGGESGGAVLLKPLHRAVIDGDRIYCVIRASTVHTAGRSTDPTAAQSASDEAVLHDACARVGVEPASIHHVEAHAFGDLDAVAGVAGVIRMALCLHHRRVPPGPGEHARPGVTPKPWPSADEPARAALSSFGARGTSCHLVLEAAPDRPILLLPFAADSPAALRRQVLAVLDVAVEATTRTEAADLCRAVAARQRHGRHRAAVTADDAEALVTGLSALLTQNAVSEPTAPRPRLVFVCSGTGSQWLGMARSLLAQEPVFHAAIEACHRSIEARCGWSLLDELFADEERSHLARIDVRQLSLFAVQTALGSLWRSWGIEPDAIVGHSIGEVAAAHLAGIVSREDGVRIIAERTRLLRDRAAGRGAMLAVTSPQSALLEELHGLEGLSIAACNSPGSLILSGLPSAVARCEAWCSERGVAAHRVDIDFAGHSAHMELLRQPLRQSLLGIDPRPAAIPMRSTVSDGWLRGPECGPDYWADNLSHPVRFRQAIEALSSAGPTVYLELSPHPLLLQAIEGTLQATHRPGWALPSCRRDPHEREALLDSLAALFRLGFDPRWRDVLHPAPRIETIARDLCTDALDESLGAPAEPHPANDETATPRAFLLSARSEPALKAQAMQLRAHLDGHPEIGLRDLACSLATTRSHFDRRAAVVAADRTTLLRGLDALATGAAAPDVVSGQLRRGGELAILFTGQGAQRPGAGRGLYQVFPVFREALDAACAEFAAHVDGSLRDVLFEDLRGPDGRRLLDQTSFTQPALFALEVALFRLLESWGVMPDLLLGHSLGEIAAAHVAGVFSLADACTLVAARARLMQALPSEGAMVAIEASEDEVAALLAGPDDPVDIASINGATSTVIAGDLDEVLPVAAHFEALGRKTSRLQVDHAFHTARMAAIADDFRHVVRGLAFAPPAIPIVCNLSGQLATAEQMTSPDYWVRHVREPVRFSDGVQTLAGHGATTFLELGPHGVLSRLAHDILSGPGRVADADRIFISALRTGRPETDSVVRAAAVLHVNGHAVAWDRILDRGRRVRLPTYPFQRQSSSASAIAGDAAGIGLSEPWEQLVIRLHSASRATTGR